MIDNTITSTLPDGKQLIITQDEGSDSGVGEPKFSAQVIDPDDHTVLFNIANAAIHDMLNSKSMTDELNSHGFNNEALSSMLQKALDHIDVGFNVTDDVRVDIGVNAGDDPGVHVGVNIKF